MTFSAPTKFAIYSVLLVHVVASSTCTGEVPLQELEENSFRQAVAHVAPSVVQIRAFGGKERIGRMLLGSGPTTGTIVSSDGYVVSSAFNFVQRPTSVLVTFAGGRRSPAKIVARDHSRMLVLIKVNGVSDLMVPEPVPRDEMKVGQWTIAMGKTFDTEPSRSVGILSAANRIWGRAIQTDAKVSPNNYGGPLVDVHGRVYGVLVPLSPHGRGEVSGAEWYDSGIGFAIPLMDIFDVLGKWKTGKDLHPGVMGVSLSTSDMYTESATIAACLPNSPARSAGLKAGDMIVEIDGKSIERQIQLKHALGSKYAGDKIRLVALRDEQRIETVLTLTDEVPPYEHPFLGILPSRYESQETGLVVRYVYPNSAADQSGIMVGDRVLRIEGKPVSDTYEAWLVLAALENRNNVKVDYRRDDAEYTSVVSLTTLPGELPGGTVPEDQSSQANDADPGRPVGVIEVKIPEYPNECFAFVPENYRLTQRHGLVVWLGEPDEFNKEEVVSRWKQYCKRYQFILLAPRAADPNRWQPTEVDFIRKTLDQVIEQYKIDPTRVVVHGHRTGGTLAYMVAFSNLDVVRAVAVVDTPLPLLLRPPANDPLQRLSIYTTISNRSKLSRRIAANIKRLKKMKYSVTVHDQKSEKGYLNPLAMDEMIRWIDTLDRI